MSPKPLFQALKILVTLMFGTSFRYCLTVVLLCLLAACATPAHKNTLFADHDPESMTVAIYPSTTYGINGVMLDKHGLKQQVESMTLTLGLKKLIIDVKGNASLLDQAIASEIGEQHGLAIFRQLPLGLSPVSSRELLDRGDYTDTSGAKKIPYGAPLSDDQ